MIGDRGVNLLDDVNCKKAKMITIFTRSAEFFFTLFLMNPFWATFMKNQLLCSSMDNIGGMLLNTHKEATFNSECMLV